MKKFATVLAAIVMLFAGTAFAMGEENVSPEVKAAFKNDFSAAQNVSWEKVSDFYFASFTFNKMGVDVAYNDEGVLVGTSRKIDLVQLPLVVSLELAKKNSEFTVTPQASEISYEGQTSYYITVENNSQIVKLKCYSNGEIIVF